jgi:transmembrane sensor
MILGNDFENLIVRYLKGECTGQEIEELKNWIDHQPGNQRIFLEIKDTWDTISKREISLDQQLVIFYRNLLEKRKTFRLSYWKQAVAVAAVLAIGLFSGVLLTTKKEVVVQSEVVYRVPLGSKSNVTLADGSLVLLNSGSTLTYPADYGKGKREVHLSGEGFFRVESDTGNPFIVNSKDFTVKVTGTEFNVCTYDDNLYSSATLAEGKIDLTFARSGQEFELKQGERLKYDRQKNRYSLHSVDVEPEVAWKDGEFIFRNIPFPDLVRRLERWYDVKLTYPADELQDFTYTGRFKNQETIWQVLDALKLTTPIDYRRVTFREFEIFFNSTHS